MSAEVVVSAPTLWERKGAVLGVLAIVLLVPSFVFAGSGPGSTDSDAKIASWYTSNSHQYTQVVAFLGFVFGAICLIAFLGVLRERMTAVDRAPGAMSQLAFGAGVASAALFVMAMALFTVPAYTALDTSGSDILPTTYRMFYTAGFVSWMAATMIGAITTWATSAMAFRTGFLPRWFAWFGVVVGLAQLAGYVFIPGFVFWLWILLAAVLLVRRR